MMPNKRDCSTIRVFLKKTIYTPDDEYAFIGMPPMVLPDHKEVHISCVFSWDKKYAEELAYQWEGRTNKPVKLGGPAFGSPVDDYIQGMYIKPNIVFTTRGCNNKCPWCIVPKVEGRLRELPIVAGNVIQDNNFLQSSRIHKNKVFDMLRTQKRICFRGGLEAKRIDDYFIDSISGLKISELWLACDTDGGLKHLKNACSKLTKAGFNRQKIRCYVLIGDDMEKNEARLQEVYHAGAMPFAQLYRNFSETKTTYSKEWSAFARMWQRPAATRAHMEKGTHYDRFKKSEILQSMVSGMTYEVFEGWNSGELPF